MCFDLIVIGFIVMGAGGWGMVRDGYLRVEKVRVVGWVAVDR